MNEELQKQLAEVIKKSLELAEQTGEFIIDQAPDLIQQFLKWHLYESIWWLFIGVILILTWIPFLKKKSIEFIDREFLFILYLIPFFASLVGFVIIGEQVLDIIKITVAPKIYLIEYFIK